MALKDCRLVEVSLVSAAGVTYTSTIGSGPIVAIVTAGETFTISATLTNPTGAAVDGSISAVLPRPVAGTKSGAYTFAAGSPNRTHRQTMSQGDSHVMWTVTAPSTPDAAPRTITITPKNFSNSISVGVMAGPSALVFTTMPLTLVAGQPSNQITIQTQNGYKNPQSPHTTVTVNLTSSSGGGFFSDPACTSAISTVSISSSANSASFYYKDSNAGNPTITVADAAGALTPGTQNETVNQASTSTAVALTSASPSVSGQPATFTATVAPVPPGAGTPSGNVQFSDNGSPLAAVPLTAGVSQFTAGSLSVGSHNITASYIGDANFLGSTTSLVISVIPPTVQITGKVLTAAGGTPIPGVTVVALNAQGNPIPLVTGDINPTNASGVYAITANPGVPVQVVFPPSAPSPNVTGQTLFLKSPARTFVGQASGAALPDTFYELRACQLSGTVLQMVGTTCQPLSGVQISLVDPTQPATVYGTTTDAQGDFCFSPASGTNFVLQLPATFIAGADTLVLSPKSLGGSFQGAVPTQTSITLTPDVPFSLPQPFIYTSPLSTVIGRVTDGQNGIYGVPVELSGQPSTVTDQTGVYNFTGVPTGPAQLRFPSPTKDASGEIWELQVGQQGTQSLSIRAGQAVQAATVAYQPEQHSVEQLVLVDGKPAENMLVDVRTNGAQYAFQSQRTGKDGKVTFVIPADILKAANNQIQVTVYPDPSASGGPQVNYVEVHSQAVSPTVNLPAPGGGGGGFTQGGDRAAIDLQAYPVLTEEMPSGTLPSTTRGSSQGAIGGTSALGQAADRAIREVLSWRTKSDDPKGFVGALGQAFDLKEVEGHTEWSWTPRSYTVQTDMGAVTGAQASIFTRAKVALDQSMPLLDGLYPLVPNVEAEDLVTVQAVVRSQFTALVNEFGTVGGPRVSRVDELFELLLGHENPDAPPTKPEEIVKGSLGLVRQRFGLQRKYVTTVDDEQNLTNYLILVDYVIGLNHSWIHDKNSSSGQRDQARLCAVLRHATGVIVEGAGRGGAGSSGRLLYNGLGIHGRRRAADGCSSTSPA